MTVNKEKDRFYKLKVALLAYTIGILVGGVFYLMKMLGRFKVINEHNFPKRQQGMIVVANHPSVVESVLLPGIFFKEYLRNPMLTPWSTPREKYYHPLLLNLAWLRPRAIKIFDEEDKTKSRGKIKQWLKNVNVFNTRKDETRSRERSNGSISQIKQMQQILQEGGRIIFFPEGGRTDNGEEFQYSHSGGKIRPLKQGVGLLAAKSQALILPIWVEGTDRIMPPGTKFPRFWSQIAFKIGDPFMISTLKKINRKTATQEIAKRILKTADE